MNKNTRVFLCLFFMGIASVVYSDAIAQNDVNNYIVTYRIEWADTRKIIDESRTIFIPGVRNANEAQRRAYYELKFNPNDGRKNVRIPTVDRNGKTIYQYRIQTMIIENIQISRRS